LLIRTTMEFATTTKSVLQIKQIAQKPVAEDRMVVDKDVDRVKEEAEILLMPIKTEFATFTKPIQKNKYSSLLVSI